MWWPHYPWVVVKVPTLHGASPDTIPVGREGAGLIITWWGRKSWLHTSPFWTLTPMCVCGGIGVLHDSLVKVKV